MISSSEMPALRLGCLTIPTPIVQGGMGIGVSLAGLAAAVANEGGVGVIATAGIGMGEPDLVANFVQANERGLRRQIREARSHTKGALGVNIMMALTNYESLARTAMDEGIDVIFSGAGLPLNLPAYRPEGCRTCLVPIVSSGRAAAIVARRWKERFDCTPDGFVVEGPLAGGHLGFKRADIENPDFKLERLVVEVLDVARELEQQRQRPVPVIAGGGIYTGADIRRFLEMGVSGVQMATRFVTTHECDASIEFKQAYMDSKAEDMEIIQSPVGMPGRAIGNSFTSDVRQGLRKPFRCAYHCIVTCDVEHTPYCIANALLSAARGDLEHGFAFAGANAWRTRELVSVRQLVESLREEYRAAGHKP